MSSYLHLGLRYPISLTLACQTYPNVSIFNDASAAFTSGSFIPIVKPFDDTLLGGGHEQGQANAATVVVQQPRRRGGRTAGGAAELRGVGVGIDMGVGIGVGIEIGSG